MPAENIINDKKKVFKRIIFSIFIISVVLLAVFYFWQKGLPLFFKGPQAQKNYIESYRLVPEKVSQSAAIIIKLPKAVDYQLAQKSVAFEPIIPGDWLPSKRAREIIFQPKEKLSLNKHYEARLSWRQSPETIIRADFLVVEDPQITAVFPQEDSEAPENSEITIVFNRPIVPLTTLSALENKNLPVEITPQTDGRFKWITTRNLQFIPTERLQRASRYKVKVKEGMVSMDSLPLKGFEREFITRVLRYQDITEGEIFYNQPILIYFNQPIDLNRTKAEIVLTDKSTGHKIPFIVQYAKNQIAPKNDFLGKTENNQEKITNNESGWENNWRNFRAQIGDWFGGSRSDGQNQSARGDNRSVLEIYQKEDRFGRAKMWDFEQSYALEIKKSYPAEGDINLEENRTVGIWVGSPIKDITAESARTNYASQSFFDPEGKLWLEFYEDIDLHQTIIKSDKAIKEIAYGEKCKDERQEIAYNPNCETTQDKKKVFLLFDKGAINPGDNFSLNFEKIVNSAGSTVNQKPIARIISVFPKLNVIRTVPENINDAKVDEFFICSNTPLLIPESKEYKEYFKANLDYEISWWGSSYRLQDRDKCKVGEFQTAIGDGLMPLSDYVVELRLEDVFGQKISRNVEFSTGEMPRSNLVFYHFQAPYNVTAPEKTRLSYAVSNMPNVEIQICKIGAFDFLYYLENKLSYISSAAAIKNCRQTINDRIELPEKYWIKNYFQIDLKKYFPDPLGHYILTFSNPNYQEPNYDSKGVVRGYRQVYERTYISVTNLAVAQKIISAPQYAYFGGDEPLNTKKLEEINNLYWVSDLNTLDPIVGAQVALYQDQSGGQPYYPYGNSQKVNLSLTGVYQTDEQGIALAGASYGLRGAIVSNGRDSAVIPSTESKLNYASEAFSAKRVYMYTDKPIYLPGQSVFIKGIYRIGYDGNYEILAGKEVALKIYNSRGDEVLNQNLTVNNFGTINTKFVLDQSAPLGGYRVCLKDWYCAYFDVQEYSAAPFEVNLKSDKEEYISKDTVNLIVDANYYFGVALEGGEVDYTISSQNYYFDKYTEDYFNFGQNWYYYGDEPYYGDRFILQGNASLDERGHTQISRQLDLNKLFKNQDDRKSKIIVVDVTVKNSQGQTVSSQKSFILHAGAFYLGLRADSSFLAKKEITKMRVKSVDVYGKPLAVKNIELRLFSVRWVQSKRLGPDGGYYYSSEKKRDLIKEYVLTTSGNGDGSQDISFDKEGEYEAEVKSNDKDGNVVDNVVNFYVYGDGDASVRSSNDISLEIEAEKNNLAIGEEGRLVIKSPYVSSMALITIERGRVFDYQIKEIKGNLYSYNFKVKEDYAPNVYVSAILLAKGPQIRFGSQEFKVKTDTKKLNIEVNSNKKFYLPGENVVLDISAKDINNQPVKSEISLAVVDLSVLALKGNPKKDPLVFFYDGFPLTVSSASNIKDILIEFEVPRSKGGGGGADSLARKKRGEFKETAFWQAVVQTDDAGKARVSFVLPDNLTTWQTEALGVSLDTKLGIDYLEFTAKKDLMVVPLEPRFIVPGDKFYIGAKVFNQSQIKQKLKVSFTSPTLLLSQDKAIKEITLAPDKTETVYFQVLAPVQMGQGAHSFVISAKGLELEDTVEQSIPITANNTKEVVATANYTAEDLAKEYLFLPDNIVADKGKLSVDVSATLALFITDGLKYLIRYPYGCSEQVASQLNAIAIIQKGLRLPNLADKLKLENIEHDGKTYTIPELVEIGLSQLALRQNWDGGFSYWDYGPSNFYLTLHVTKTIFNLDVAGFKINRSSLEKAINYLYQEITNNKSLFSDNNTLIVAAYHLLKMTNYDSKRPYNENLRQKIVVLMANTSFLKEKISNSALAYLTMLLQKDFPADLKDRAWAVLDNRLSIDSRGAFLDNKGDFLWQYYETPIKNTALYLAALSEEKRESPVLDKLVRWLLNSRDKDGAWGSTNNTLTVIDAFTAFLEWKRETESNFHLTLAVDGQPKGEFDFNSDTILSQFQKTIPIKELPMNKNVTIDFTKINRNALSNSLYYAMALEYYLPIEQIPPRDEGFSVTREFYAVNDKDNKNPLKKAKVGEVLRGHLQITLPQSRNFVVVEDYIPAGLELVNLDLATEQKSLLLQEREIKNRELFVDFKELRNDRLVLFTERLEAGVYEFDYFIRPLIRGTFSQLPAQASEMYFPENFGRTDGRYFEVE